MAFYPGGPVQARRFDRPFPLREAYLLVVPLVDYGFGHCVNDIVRAAALQLAVRQFIVDMPAIVVECEMNAVAEQIMVSLQCIGLGDRQYLIARQDIGLLAADCSCSTHN